MARTTTLRKDPWRDLIARQGNEQVGLEQVLSGLEVEANSAGELKRELVQRVQRLTRNR